MNKPIVAVTRRLPASTEARMTELFEARLNRTDVELTKEQIIALCDDAQILVPTVTDKIDAKLISNLSPSVRMIANFGAGVDHIDIDAARSSGIVVTNTPDVLTEDTADLAFALLLTVPRRMSEGARILRDGKWKGWTPTFLMGYRVTGKRLGIIGMGRIGQA
ncbi:MAG: D-glycerate dehydrogenase, partial [Rhodospirillaceae bacterium]|nr:D-glycerate dehydrogenase [Rhodospirillaceae bacterium]